MPTKKVIEQGKEFQVPSAAFNHLFVVNLSPSTLEIELTHSDLIVPVLIIRGADEDKEMQDVLKKYEGKEI